MPMPSSSFFFDFDFWAAAAATTRARMKRVLMVDILLIRFLAVLFVDLSRRMLLPSSAGDHFYMVPFFSFFLLLSPFSTCDGGWTACFGKSPATFRKKGKDLLSFPTLPPGNRGG